MFNICYSILCNLVVVDSSADVDFCDYGTWPVAWGTNTVAKTFAFDNDNNSFLSSSYDGTSVYAVIYPNRAFNALTDYMMRLVLGHELGHVLGLGHPSDGTTSIMTQGQESWETPQAHDRSDLSSFY